MLLVPAVLVPTLCFLWGDRINCLPQRVVHQTVLRVHLLVHAIAIHMQPCLDAQKGEFDRVEIRRICRKEHEVHARCLNQLADAINFVY